MPRPEWRARCLIPGCGWRTWEHHQQEALDGLHAHYLDKHWDAPRWADQQLRPFTTPTPISDTILDHLAIASGKRRSGAARYREARDAVEGR